MISIPGDDRNAVFTIGDFCRDTDGKGKYQFSRADATDALFAKLDLAMTAGGKDVFYFDGQIYRPVGIPKMKQAMYSTALDFAKRRGVGEVVDRVMSELLLKTVMFNLNPYVMPLQNGVLNLETGEFRAYRADDYLSFKYGASWEPEGSDWRRLIWFLCTSLPDPGDVLTAIDVMTAIALRVPFDVIVQLLGGGANGKGTFERVLLALFTAERSTAIELAELKSSRFGPGALLDVDLWIISEVEGVKDAISALKKIATGEFLDADVKYGGRTRGKPHAVPILDSNNAFDFGDDSYGRKRRILRLDFPYTFGYEAWMRPIDRHLEDKLTSPESLAGISQIIAARAPDLIASKKIFTRKSSEASEAEYERQRFSLKYFCDECLGPNAPSQDAVLITRENKERKTPRGVASAYDAYLEYCDRFKVPTPASPPQLGSYISKKYGIQSANTRINGDQYRIYNGLFLERTPSEAYAEFVNTYNSATDSYSKATVKLQKDKVEIAIGDYVSENSYSSYSNLMKSVIEEICKMYLFISSCENEKDLRYENYLEFAVAAVAAVTKTTASHRFSCETSCSSSVAEPEHAVAALDDDGNEAKNEDNTNLTEGSHLDTEPANTGKREMETPPAAKAERSETKKEHGIRSEDEAALRAIVYKPPEGDLVGWGNGDDFEVVE